MFDEFIDLTDWLICENQLQLPEINRNKMKMAWKLLKKITNFW